MPEFWGWARRLGEHSGGTGVLVWIMTWGLGPSWFVNTHNVNTRLLLIITMDVYWFLGAINPGKLWQRNNGGKISGHQSSLTLQILSCLLFKWLRQNWWYCVLSVYTSPVISLPFTAGSWGEHFIRVQLLVPNLSHKQRLGIHSIWGQHTKLTRLYISRSCLQAMVIMAN